MNPDPTAQALKPSPTAAATGDSDLSQQAQAQDSAPASDSPGSSVAKNAGFLMGSHLLTWSMSLVLLVFLPRYLGPTDVGRFHFANAIWYMVAVFVAFGTDTLITKHVARQPAAAGDLFGVAVALRTILFALGYVGTTIFLRIFDYPPETTTVVAIVGVSFLILQVANVCQATIIGLEQMSVISLANIASKLVLTAAAILMLVSGRGVYAVAGVIVLSSLVSMIIQLNHLARRYRLRVRFDPGAMRRLAQASLPYLMSMVFLVVYMQVDIVIISLLVDEKAVGWYGTADQLFGTLLFIPSIFVTAIFPRFARLHVDAPNSLGKSMAKSFEMLLLLSVPLGLGMVVIAEPLVQILFGPAFFESGLILAVFGVVLILTYQNILLGQFLISTDRQNAWTVVMAIATVATIPLDFLFIPWCNRVLANGPVGGAMAFVVTETGMMVAGLFLLPAGTLGRAQAWTALRIGFAGVMMAAVIWQVREQMIVVPILLGAALYLGMILLLRVIPAEDWALLKSTGRRILHRSTPAALEATAAQPAESV